MRIEYLTTMAMGMLLAGGLALAQTTRPADRAEQPQLDGRHEDAPEYRPAPRSPEQSYSSSIPEPAPPRDMSLPGLARQYVVDGLSVQLTQAQLIEARQQARSVLYQLYADVNDGPQLVQARERIRDARLAYLEAREAVMRQLSQDEGYRDALQQRVLMDDRIEELRRSSGGDRARVVAMARMKLQLAAIPSEMERDALQKSDEYRQARERMLEAQQSHDRLLDRLNKGVPDSPLYASAMDRVNELERRLTSQWIGLAGVRAAYAQALVNQAIELDAYGNSSVNNRYGTWFGNEVDVSAPLDGRW